MYMYICTCANCNTTLHNVFTHYVCVCVCYPCMLSVCLCVIRHVCVCVFTYSPISPLVYVMALSCPMLNHTTHLRKAGRAHSHSSLNM